MNRIKRGVAAALLACGFVGAVYAATPLEEAQAHITQGQYQEALQTLDGYLAHSPQDAEARFTRGLVLVKLNRTQEAIKAFSDLTRDYPQLPEPYNNLAVLYAQQGEYEKARDALEAALATHPNYATAHENLGDIYAALAGAAYQRSLILDKENAGIRAKLALINQINAPISTGSRVTGTPAAAAPPPPPAPPPAALVTPAPGAAPVAAAPGVATPPQVTSAPTVKSAPPPIEVGTADAGKAATDAVLAWAKAWSEQNVDGYLGAYDAEYHPAGHSHKTWAAERRARISAPKHISVEVQNARAQVVSPTKVRVTFHEIYQSSSLSDESNKMLELTQTGGAWKITHEASQ